ncbi:hypothetical protein QBC37DRAFT_424353 [Rhypophila decipiens]|uniref:Secreted protein n=1 Tax=Rhypophila decipiens TaxID=261697 RepID=A0AAN6Y4Y6_9PEZI|nr:hypothetical protein QBC37DRAFT_424353 [Rhypophila decipiens]
MKLFRRYVIVTLIGFLGGLASPLDLSSPHRRCCGGCTVLDAWLLCKHAQPASSWYDLDGSGLGFGDGLHVEAERRRLRDSSPSSCWLGDYQTLSRSIFHHPSPGGGYDLEPQRLFAVPAGVGEK